MKCRNSQPFLPGGTSSASPHSSARAVKGSRSGLFCPGSERGVALVLTLIMLAIITVVVVVFLASARRTRQSTTLRQHQTDSEFAAESAFQRASGEIMATILRDTNLLAFDFLVSRGFGNVPIVTNRAGTIDVYLDLDRDGIFTDPREPTNAPFGDPMWIGISDKPWRPEAADNKYVARMAYAVLPAGKMLDLNTIHNAASPNNSGYRYLRNQGFGPWEINLAAFLTELNPEVWGGPEYSYGPFPQPIADGAAFADAWSITEFRRGWDLATRVRTPLYDVFPNAYAGGVIVFPPTSIDAYGDGAGGGLGGSLLDFPFDNDSSDIPKITTGHWFGSDPTNHWFNHQELFDNVSYKVTNTFLTNLLHAMHGDAGGTIQPTPRAFYKIMSQLGFDTGSDYDNRINLNYADEHADDGSGKAYVADEFFSWSSNAALRTAFFTNVAERIFLAQSNEFNNLSTNQLPIRSINEIPIYPTNLYSLAIHRILQQAANILDATTTNAYPSVFRPLFGPGPIAGVNYIRGWEHDDRVSTLQNWLEFNTNGIPLVIGAKKGLPNFNEFTLRSDVLITRKLEVQRPNAQPGTRPNGTNQMYVLGISNYFGAEAWNPYEDSKRPGPYPRGARITVSNIAVMSLTNTLGFQTSGVMTVAAVTNLVANTWRGGEQIGFVLPFDTNMVFLSNAVYRFGNNSFANISTNDFERNISGFPLPYWVYTISNRLTYLMSDNDGPYERIVDFVLLQDNHTTDLFRDLVGAQNPYEGISGISSAVANVWNTNRASPNAPTEGIRQQMSISLGNAAVANAEWRAYGLTQTRTENDKQKAIDAFRVFCGFGALTTNQIGTNNTTEMQSPFNPAAKLSVLSTWQANDPIVHYHVSDLKVAGSFTNHQYLKPLQAASNTAPSSLGRLNDVYSPWGGRPTSSYEEPTAHDISIKDPGVNSPDDWRFPTNKLASIGLLGRIHRGTPWQTVYFKSTAAPNRTWTNLSPDMVLHASGQLFSRTHPTNDWKLADMFTTSIDERTSRGLMSVNQTNMESWSALLSGVTVISNSIRAPLLGQQKQYVTNFVEPWGGRPFEQSPFAMIWSNIFWLQRFPDTEPIRPLRSVGDILQVPQLTVASPFLNQAGDQVKWGLDDFAYERIPQQILSLLRVGNSRFVIYAYGQALRPADIDPSNGRVRNYQVTAEYATRTVVRAEGDPRARVRLVVESFNVLPPD
jgi:hypothetical protein